MKHFIFLIMVMLMNTNGQDITNLTRLVEKEFNSLDGTFAVSYINLANLNDRLAVNGDTVFHAASTMKTPVMVQVMRDVSEGRMSLEDSVLVKNEFKSIVDGSSYSMDIGDDSGEKLYELIGHSTTIRELVFQMITVSSNLATNILIDIIDARRVMATLQDLGVNGVTVLRGVEDGLAFNAGLNNTVTANGLAELFSKIYIWQYPDAPRYNEMISILRQQQFKDLIPSTLPKGVIVAHKTGSITGVMHDSGLIYLPDGRVYVLVILGKGIKNVPEVKKMYGRVSEAVYKYVTGE